MVSRAGAPSIESRNGASEDEPDAAREGRRRDRLTWPLRRYELGAEPGDDLSAQTTAGERLAMVWPLTVLSWRLAGRSIPSYDRSRMPGAVVRSDAPG